MSNNIQFIELVARHCATNRLHFGPKDRRDGVIEHIRSELDEIKSAGSHDERANEWVDVLILALDGLERSAREHIRESDTSDGIERIDGEPTNNSLAEDVVRRIVCKLLKNEIRDFGDWRQSDSNRPQFHAKGIYD